MNRQHHPDELTPEQQNRMCPSCRLRYAFPPPATRQDFNGIRLSDANVRWLENAARAFVADSDPEDAWTAEDFIAWIKPDLTGRVPEFPTLGRPVDYDDEKHVKDREYQAQRRKRPAA